LTISCISSCSYCIGLDAGVASTGFAIQPKSLRH
jgi:hypothetical protein